MARQSAASHAATGRALVRFGKQRKALGAKYNVAPSAFYSRNLLATIKQHDIPLAEIPEEFFNAFPAKKRHALVEKRAANGHDTGGPGIGIPLDAIPERKRNSASASTKGATAKARNVEIIAKIVDVLAKPDTSDAVAERLSKVLDKLI